MKCTVHRVRKMHHTVADPDFLWMVLGDGWSMDAMEEFLGVLADPEGGCEGHPGLQCLYTGWIRLIPIL